MTSTDESVDDGQHFWGSIWTGALLGFVIGGTLGLLYAPKSGRELRGDLEDVADGARAQAETKIDDLQESAVRLASLSRSLIEETQQNIIRSVEAGREAYERKRSEMTSQLEAQLRGETDAAETSGSGV